MAEAVGRTGAEQGNAPLGASSSSTSQVYSSLKTQLDGYISSVSDEEEERGKENEKSIPLAFICDSDMESVEPEILNQWALVPFDPEKARTAMLASLISRMTLEARNEGGDGNMDHQTGSRGVDQLVGEEITENREVENSEGVETTERGGGDKVVGNVETGVSDEAPEGGPIDSTTGNEGGDETTRVRTNRVPFDDDMFINDPIPQPRTSKKKKASVKRKTPMTKAVRKSPRKKTKTVSKGKQKTRPESSRRTTRQSARTAQSTTTASPQHSDSDFQPESGDDTETDSAASIMDFDGFSSEKAQAAFEKHKNKPALPERGFNDMTIQQHDFIRRVIEQQNWSEICEVHHSYNLTLVRQFYAEAAAKRTTTIRVRGVKVNYSAEAINSLFGLDPPADTDFDELMTKAAKEDLDDMIKVLGQPDTDWSFHSNYMLRTFRASSLTPNANVWMNFIRHTLSPTTHDSSIKAERIIMLHCIMEGKSMNVGEIILKRLRYCAGRVQGKLFFPILIRRLCLEAGVPEYEADEIIKEGEEKWTLGLKEVTRLREKAPKGSGDLAGVVQSLVDQNKDLMDELLREKREAVEKRKLKVKQVKAKLIAKKKKVLDKLRVQKQKNEQLAAENKTLTDTNQRLETDKLDLLRQTWELKKELQELQKKEAAAANAAALATASGTAAAEKPAP